MTEPAREIVTPGTPSVHYCGAPTATGEPCRQIVGVGTGRCLWHDPERAEEAASVRGHGGRTSRPPAPESTEPATEPPPQPTTLEGVCEWLAWVAVEVSSGRLDPKRGSSLTYTLQNLQRAIATRDLEQKYKELERRLAAMQRGMH